jgi:hypothetical protein
MTVEEKRQDEREGKRQSILFHTGRVENDRSVLFQATHKKGNREKKYNEKIEATSMRNMKPKPKMNLYYNCSVLRMKFFICLSVNIFILLLAHLHIGLNMVFSHDE